VARIEAVSVIMPAYNAMPYVREAVESILRQTFRGIELIVVDDGSTDGTGAYLDSLTDPRVRVIRQANQGDAAASNAALRAAKHEWAARMDADDVALPERIEREVAFLEANPQYDLVGCGWGYIGPDGRRLKAVHRPQLSAPPRFQPLVDSMIVHPGLVYRRSAVLAAGGYADDLAGDLDLCLKLDEAGLQTAAIPDVLVLVRVLPKGVSSENYIRQFVFVRYAREASLARRRGEPVPDWSRYEQEHWPRGWRRMRAEGRRQFRLAGAAWAAGRAPAALLRLLASFVLRPDYVVRKLRLYFASGSRPHEPPEPIE